MNPAPEEAQHLCVLIHGLWGNPVHLKYLEKSLRKHNPEKSLYILRAETNASNHTYDGIEVGGERIAHEVAQKIEELEQAGAKLSKISVVGYSLGGLVARYAIGLFHQDGLFEKLEPINFTTFASPHLGVRTPMKGFMGYAFNEIGSRTLSASGRQMWALDSFRDTGRPLLAVMASPNSIFMAGLRRFRKKSLYCNTHNDRSVPYFTSMISPIDPYEQLDRLDLHFLPGQSEDVILDPERPVSLRPYSKDEHTLAARLLRLQRSAISNIPFYALLTVFMPIGISFLLINSGYQSFRSVERVRLHEEGLAGIQRGRYRVPLLEGAKAVHDRALERLAVEHNEQHLPTPPSESPRSSSPAEKEARAGVSAKDLKSDFPILALTDEQFTMIDNLNDLGITKYAVHITKVRHTHAAIVVRNKRSAVSQGKAVVSHWATEFEV